MAYFSTEATTGICAFQSAAVEEKVLEPDLPVIDAHHHLWDIRPTQYSFLSHFEQKVYLLEDITTILFRLYSPNAARFIAQMD